LAATSTAPASLCEVAQFVNRFWRTVGSNYEAMNENAPDGYKAVVLAYFVGDQTPVPVGVVESRRDYSFFLIHSIIENVEKPTIASPTDRLVFADESQLSRVEIRYLRDEPETEIRYPLGFSVKEAPPDQNE
jgi:hypothetical protein